LSQSVDQQAYCVSRIITRIILNGISVRSAWATLGGGDGLRIPSDGNAGLAVQDIHRSIKRHGMFAEPLPPVKRNQRDVTDFLIYHCLSYHGTRCVFNMVFQVKSLAFRRGGLFIKSAEKVEQLFHMIRQALKRNNGNWSAAARDLNMHRSNLHDLAKRLGLKP
jgi:hypothetical protein